MPIEASSPSQITRLVPVDVREVWPMEASSFTPWLFANAATLGEILGVDLVLDEAEHKVGGYSLDLRGHDATTEEVVIIENQFGPTDHRHLGQLLTYAGGTDPTTIVWIAESFRDEHRAALDWLNKQTGPETRFFGVQLRAVRMEAGPSNVVAPLLDVVAMPNDWSKTPGLSPTSSPTSRELLYREFWGAWLERVKPRHWTNKKAPSKHWMSLPATSGHVRYTVSFRSDGMLSELFFRHSNPLINLERWEALASRRELIEASFGGPLDFDDLPERKGCRVGIHSKDGATIDKQAQWPTYMDWFEDTQARLRHAIEGTGGIPPVPTLAATDEPDEIEDED